jgi:hypothetical protein
MLPLISPSNSSESFETAINNFMSNAITSYKLQITPDITFQTYASFWAYYMDNNGPLSAGGDVILGSRLLDGQALTGNLTALKQAFRTATPPGAVTEVNVVAGKNVWNAHPRDGSNSVNPAWRAYAHTSTFYTRSYLSREM